MSILLSVSFHPLTYFLLKAPKHLILVLSPLMRLLKLVRSSVVNSLLLKHNLKNKFLNLNNKLSLFTVNFYLMINSLACELISSITPTILLLIPLPNFLNTFFSCSSNIFTALLKQLLNLFFIQF